MNVDVTPAAPDEQPIVRALFELYTYDFSPIMGLDVEGDGRFRVRPLEKFWSDPRCHAFLFRVQDKLAGFALVQQRSRLSGDESVCDMDQFFVLRRYRRHGVGERAAHLLFDRFRGRWEIREEHGNDDATAFWRRVIERYTGAAVEERLFADEKWHGPVQLFDSSQARVRK